MFSRFLISFTLIVSFRSYAQLNYQNMWRGKFSINDSVDLNILMNVIPVKGSYKISFQNAEEKIQVEKVTRKGDTLSFRMPIFDNEFRVKISKTEMKGYWYNYARKEKNIIPFEAKLIKPKPVTTCQCNGLTGKWETTFEPNTPNAYKAIGKFRNGEWDLMYGTFLTETGDYRYLSGMPEIDSEKGDTIFRQQCFDGSHAFVFKGKLKNGKIVGDVYYGIHGHETFEAVRNDKFELRDPNKITQVVSQEKVNFSFKNTEGKLVSINDERYKNKVVIIQIMGSWCPNCMDETKYLSKLYESYKSKGLEIIALAYEKTNDFKKASENVLRLKKRFNAGYEFLITEQTGKAKASETFKLLNEISAFPTTIFIDKKGEVRKIYTGYNGPATGEAHETMKKETEEFLNKILAEK